MSGARGDGTYPRAVRLEALRLVKCDKWPAARVAAKLRCSTSSVFGWLRNEAEVAMAMTMGPLEAGPPPPVEKPPPDIGESLPPLGEEDPGNPTPEFMRALCRQWALIPQPESLDRLAGWPEGTVQGWFDRERTDRACAIRCAQLRRAAEVVQARAMEDLLASKNAVALTKVLISRGALTEAPSEKGNGAEGHPLDAIRAELRRRLVEGGEG